jgi:hypothetical protein
LITEIPPPEFFRGVEQFNQQQFYPCHDTLEALWMEASEPDKTFYQGILQIAVACYHLENHNWRGAVILLGEGIRKLRDYQPHYGQVKVNTLVGESGRLLTELQRIESTDTPSFAQKLKDSHGFPRIKLLPLGENEFQ